MALAAPIIEKRGKEQLTLSDLASRLDPDGSVAEIAEILSQNNEILKDIPWIEGNLPTGHIYTVRTGLPEAFWISYNQGVPASKSSTAQMEETCARCAARSSINKRIVELNGNSLAFLHSENIPFIESINQSHARALFYGQYNKDSDDSAGMKGFPGFTYRYNTLDPAKADNAKNVIDMGGSKNLTSVWCIAWGPRHIYSIYPKGSKVGLEIIDRGSVRDFDVKDNPIDNYETEYHLLCGLCVQDWRYAVRICNIDTEALNAGDGKALVKKMYEALNKIPEDGSKNAKFYMNADVHAALNAAAMDATLGSVLKIQSNMTEFGEHYSWTTFLGREIRRVDALTKDEVKVTK